MSAEVEFVEGDWAALRWACGSSAALCAYSLLRRLKEGFDTSFGVRPVRKLAWSGLAALSGIGAASVVLAVCTLILSGLLQSASFDPSQHKLADRLLIVVVPESVYVASAVIVWRRRKAVAIGFLTSGVILITHAIVHYATHV